MSTYERRMITRIFEAFQTTAKPLMKNYLFPLFVLLFLPCVPLKAQSLGGTLKADPGSQ